MSPIIGMDVLIDEKGRLQTWRVVVSTLETPYRGKEFLMRLPSSLLYMTPPHDAVYGDLREIGNSPEEQFRAISDEFHEMGATQAYVASAHLRGNAVAMLAWHGISVIPMEVKFPDHGYLEDPYGIGGQAAHEIDRISRQLGVIP